MLEGERMRGVAVTLVVGASVIIVGAPPVSFIGGERTWGDIVTVLLPGRVDVNEVVDYLNNIPTPSPTVAPVPTPTHRMAIHEAVSRLAQGHRHLSLMLGPFPPKVGRALRLDGGPFPPAT
jgi:hypothetical protein